MRRAASLACLWLFSGCAGLLHAPAEGRPEGETADTALLRGMNLDLLGPHVRRVEVEVDAVEGWAPGEKALDAMRAQLRQWVRAGAEIDVRVDGPIPLDRWHAAEGTFAQAADLIRSVGDRARTEGDVAKLHVVYLPTLRAFGQSGALGLTILLPHGPQSEDMRSTAVLATDRIQKIAALWIGPRKVETTVLVHELGHVFGLVADGAHQHRGDPSHCRNASCLMVSSGNRGAAVVAAPRAIFLGRLPTSYCPVCRTDLGAARALFASRAQDTGAWEALQVEKRREADDQRIGFLLQSGDPEAAVAALQSLPGDPTVAELWQLARTLRGLGRSEEALQAGERLAALEPQGAVGTRAVPLMDMGRWDDALQEIEKAKALGTHDARLEMRALLGAGRVEEADARLRAAIDASANPQALAWFLRERLWLRRAADDLPQGLALLRTIPKRQLRSDDDLTLEAGRLLLARGSTKEAEELLRPLAREKKASHRRQVGVVAHARALTGDAEGALRALARTSEWFYPGDLSLLRGEILAALQREDEALTALEEARRAGASPEVPCLDPDLARLRLTHRFQALYRCGKAADGSLASVDGLAARVASAPVRAGEPQSVLIVAARLGNELIPSVSLSDPDWVETLDVYFDDWVFSARAHLLLDHARATLGLESAPDYSGWTEMQAAVQRSKDAEDRTRITRVVSEGHYDDAWAPFVDAYRSFRTDALKEIPEGPPDLALLQRVNERARDHGLHELVADLPIGPRHVAEEMLRLVTDFRQMSGGPEGNLFYACDGEVRFRTSDPLGMRLLDAVTHDPEDPITTAFKRLQDDFLAWSKRHPDAGQLEQDDYLRGAAEDLGLLRLLTEAGDRSPAHP